MTTYFFWGDDEYKINLNLVSLKASLDPSWLDFNYAAFTNANDSQVIDALNQAATFPLGAGDRLTCLVNTTIAQRCGEELYAELARTLKNLPTNSHLIFTSSLKPDGRIKSTKLLQKYAQVQEFSLIPSWNTKAIAQLVKELAHAEAVSLTEDGIDFLVEAVGSDRRRLVMELQKLKLFSNQPLTALVISQLVNQTAHNSFQLASAIRQGQTSPALQLLGELMANNEAGLKIASTLTSQFRTWLWVKLLLETNERDDKVIATAAEISNPKRIYFFKQEVQHLSSSKLTAALSVILKLEQSLKTGANEAIALQTAVVELCNICQ